MTERDVGRQLDAADAAAFAVLRTGHETLRQAGIGGHEVGPEDVVGDRREVERVRPLRRHIGDAVEDEVVQLFGEGRDGHIARIVREILLKRRIEAGRLERTQLRVAAAACDTDLLVGQADALAEEERLTVGNAADVVVQADARGRLELLHARAGQRAGRAETEVGVFQDLEAEVGRWQHVGVLRAVGDQGEVAALHGRTRGLLVGADHLQAQIAAHRHAAEARVQIDFAVNGGDVLFHVPRLGDHVGVEVGTQRVHAGRQDLVGVIADHVAEAEKRQIGRCQQRVARNRRAVAIGRTGEVDEGLDAVLVLGARRVVGPDLEAGHDAVVDLAVDFAAQRRQFVIGLRLLDEADLAPAARIGQLDAVGVFVVLVRVEHERAVVAQLEAQIGRTRTRIGFEVAVIALDARVGDVEVDAPLVGEAVVGVEAEAHEVRLARAHVVADHAVLIGERTGGHDAVGFGESLLQLCARPEERELDAAQDAAILERGVETVRDDLQIVGRCELQRADHGVALQVAAFGIGLGAADDGRVVGARRRIAPGFPALGLARGGLRGAADHPAERTVGVLADIGAGQAIAVIVGAAVELAQVVDLIACIDDEVAVAVIVQRADRAQVHRAGQARADQSGVRRLVHDGGGQQLGRELVEFHAAIVAGGDLFAAVQQRGREVRAETADRKDLGAATHALGGKARQARQRFRDRDVRQLADVLGAHGLDDGGLVALQLDGALDGGDDAGGDDFVDDLFIVGGLCRGCAREERHGDGGTAHEQAAVKRKRFH